MDPGDKPVIDMLQREAVRSYWRGLMWGTFYGSVIAAILLR